MVTASDIRAHMEVLGSDGAHVGTVDHVDGDRIKLARRDSADAQHHYVPLSSVARVDAHVHLTTTAAALGIPAVAAAGAAEGPLPPVRNRAVDDPKPRGNFYLPWIVGIVGLILLFLLLRSCLDDRDPAPVAAAPAPVAPAPTPELPVETVTLPGGATVDLAPQTLNYELQRYLASNEAAPRTFTFEQLNFDTGSAAIRAGDAATIDALGRILAAYPNARVRLVGYTDARGGTGSNANLGEDRAEAVEDALEARGIADARIDAASGGETNPVGSNATGEGQFENRRTELVVTAK